MHACELAEQVGIGTVLVPLAPGVTSALGTLFVDIVHDVARSYISALGRLDVGPVEAIFVELESEADSALAGDRVAPERRALQRSLDLRYVGQLKTLSIPVPADPFSTAVAAGGGDRCRDRPPPTLPLQLSSSRRASGSIPPDEL